jgi:thioredoxin reductase/NAD-dependent dihydropyrimidine dehydrogenase PreA subunit
MKLDPLLLFYAAPLLAIWTGYAVRRRRLEAQSLATHRESIEAGLSEPASLHPVFDPARCIGCRACVNACPEGTILGIINGKAALVEPANCIGHGACKAACPRGAISLVLGTAKRGVDIPHVAPDFQTNVPGIYVAGELGGMGLIRNAIEQGRQAMEEIAKRGGMGGGGGLDVVVIGAGPAGISASLAAIERKLRYVTLEQDTLGGTVGHFPRGKVVMTAPATLPIVGKTRFKEVGKEKLLGFWQKVARETGLRINEQERVQQVIAEAGGFRVVSTRAQYRARAVLLAIGRRGTPRKLGVPGEEQSKVVYRLIDAEQYRGQRVLVVGGGDSALEAAASLADQPGTTVTLSYRSKAFSRAKPKNRARVDTAVSEGRIRLMLGTEVAAIGADRVRLTSAGQPVEIGNDAVIVCAGGILPTDFLKSIGIEIETKYGTA